MDKLYVHIIDATDIPDAVLDAIMNQPHQVRSKRKEKARHTHRANGTHSRDHAHTLKAQRDRHGEVYYNRGARELKRRKADNDDFTKIVNELFFNHQNGHGFVLNVDDDYADIFFDDDTYPEDDYDCDYYDEFDFDEFDFNRGYDRGHADGYALGFEAGFNAAQTLKCDNPSEDCHNDGHRAMPWENLDLVMYLFEDSVKFNRQHEKYAVEFELMRAALKHGVNLITNGSNKFGEINYPTDILILLLGVEGWDYMIRFVTQCHVLENVAHNLYALSQQPELHQYYLDNLKTRDAN